MVGCNPVNQPRHSVDLLVAPGATGCLCEGRVESSMANLTENMVLRIDFHQVKMGNEVPKAQTGGQFVGCMIDGHVGESPMHLQHNECP